MEILETAKGHHPVGDLVIASLRHHHRGHGDGIKRILRTLRGFVREAFRSYTHGPWRCQILRQIANFRRDFLPVLRQKFNLCNEAWQSDHQ